MTALHPFEMWTGTSGELGPFYNLHDLATTVASDLSLAKGDSAIVEVGGRVFGKAIEAAMVDISVRVDSDGNASVSARWVH